MIPLFRVFMAPEAGENVSRVLGSGYIGQGSRVDRFERELTRFLDAPVPVLTLNSCTSAIDLALHLIGVKEGDEVITTPMTCAATNVHIKHRGADIVWADVDPVYGLIDPEDVRRKITRKTKAILAVDWAGRPCDYEALKSFGIPVIEDAAHSFGAVYQKKPVARTGGDYICWSFQAIKHLTTGDGGALMVPAAQYERAKLLRWYGLDRTQGDSFRCSQDLKEAGYKYHMNDIAAEIGLANLPYMEKPVLEKHRDNAWQYTWRISKDRGLVLPEYTKDSSWWLFTLHTPRRDDFVRYLAQRGIAASQVHARNDLHSTFQNTVPLRMRGATLPGVTRFCETQVSIPVGWWLTPSDRSYIIDVVNDWSP